MTPIMIYDFETSGLPLWNEPSSDPRQPHIVQAGALLVDTDTRETISSVNLIVQPDGWEIPDEVAEIHGIDTSMANRVGVPERQVVSAIWAFHRIAVHRVAHNESFDARIMRIALKRFGTVADTWSSAVAVCTAKLSQPIVDLPPTEAMRATGRHGPKLPKLTEAYQFFTGKSLVNAHSALADAEGCAEVYWALLDRGAA